MSDQLGLFNEPPKPIKPIEMGTGGLKFYQGNFPCAHKGCDNIVRFFVGKSFEDDVWCQTHRSEARR